MNTHTNNERIELAGNGSVEQDLLELRVDDEDIVETFLTDCGTHLTDSGVAIIVLFVDDADIVSSHLDWTRPWRWVL